MRRVAVLVLAAAAALTVGGQSAGSPGKASLRVLGLQPFTVRGDGFAARERLRVNLYGVSQATHRVVANRSGVFVVRFADVRATRCDLIRVVAIRRGGQVWLKRLPSPACHTGIGVGEGLSLRAAASGVP
jgi:hypothetical protein